MNNKSNYPYIDPGIHYIGISKLRNFNATKLKNTENTFVIQENDEPLAVLIKYDKYMALLEELKIK